MEKGRQMTVPDGDGPGAGDDVLELGRQRRRVPRWPPPAALIPAAVALVAGLAAGYAAGARHPAAPATPPGPSRAAPAAAAAPFSAGGFPLSQSGPQCSVQTGRALQVGLQITNLSPAPVRLRRAEVVLPLGGLTVTAQTWGPCGQLPATGHPARHPLPPALRPGASTWLTITFHVLAKCPQPLPVQFTLHYDQQGHPAAIRLPGFTDLGQVPYSGCR
jgi:hypothetical protein